MSKYDPFEVDGIVYMRPQGAGYTGRQVIRPMFEEINDDEHDKTGNHLGDNCYCSHTPRAVTFERQLKHLYNVEWEPDIRL